MSSVNGCKPLPSPGAYTMKHKAKAETVGPNVAKSAVDSN